MRSDFPQRAKASIFGLANAYLSCMPLIRFCGVYEGFAHVKVMAGKSSGHLQILDAALLTLLFWLTGSLNRAAENDGACQAASTRGMAERLQKTLRESNVMITSFLNSRRVEILQRQLDPVLALPPTPENLTRLVQTQSRHAIEWLNAGKTEKAVQQFEQLQKLVIENGAYDAERKNWLRPYPATAYLRLGELENCFAHHGHDSCLLPVRGSGVHTEQCGSRGAIRVRRQQWAEFPKDSDYPVKCLRDIAPSLGPRCGRAGRWRDHG
jgi:hypothetical protein